VYGIKSFENINKDNEEWLQSDACEVGFQHMKDKYCQCCCKTEGKRRGWGGLERNVKFCECTKQNILDYPCFSIICASSPLH
jgi:hypothetical protein